MVDKLAVGRWLVDRVVVDNNLVVDRTVDRFVVDRVAVDIVADRPAVDRLDDVVLEACKLVDFEQVCCICNSIEKYRMLNSFRVIFLF